MHAHPRQYARAILQESAATRWVLLGSGAALLAVAIVSFSIDAQVSSWLTSSSGAGIPGDLKKAIHLSEAFAHGSGVAVILGTLLLLNPQRRRALWVAVLITATSGLLANGMKAAVVRVRPYAKDKIVVAGHGNYFGAVDASALPESQVEVQASFWDAQQRSFPSGHAATAWALALSLMLVFPRGAPIFVMLAACASLQRIIGEAHYPSDVLCGAAVAFLVAGVVLSFSRPREMLASAT